MAQQQKTPASPATHVPPHGIEGGTAASPTAAIVSRLEGRMVALLATDGFEQSELMEPKRALEQAGATVCVVAPRSGRIRGWKMKDWGDEVAVDRVLDETDPGDFDALVLPGGTLNADKLRINARAVGFVRAFFDQNKPVAAICHAPWLLVEAGVVDGVKLTSWPSLQTDIRNAGGVWEDEEAVHDGLLVTSRKPDDLPAFNRTMIDAFASSGQPAAKVRVKVGAPDVS